MPRRRKWASTFVFLPGKSHRQRSLVGYSLQSMGLQRVGQDLVTEHTHKHKDATITILSITAKLETGSYQRNKT